MSTLLCSLHHWNFGTFGVFCFWHWSKISLLERCLLLLQFCLRFLQWKKSLIRLKISSQWWWMSSFPELDLVVQPCQEVWNLSLFVIVPWTCRLWSVKLHFIVESFGGAWFERLLFHGFAVCLLQVLMLCNWHPALVDGSWQDSVCSAMPSCWNLNNWKHIVNGLQMFHIGSINAAVPHNTGCLVAWFRV